MGNVERAADRGVRAWVAEAQCEAEAIMRMAREEPALWDVLPRRPDDPAEFDRFRLRYAELTGRLPRLAAFRIALADLRGRCGNVASLAVERRRRNT